MPDLIPAAAKKKMEGACKQVAKKVGKAVKGVLLDITGVLVESSAVGDGRAIQGSVDAVKRLDAAGSLSYQ